MRNYLLYLFPLFVFCAALSDIYFTGVSRESIAVIGLIVVMVWLQYGAEKLHMVTVVAYITLGVASILHSNIIDVSSFSISEETYLTIELVMGFASISHSFRVKMEM